jgi:hypothetical protein
MSCLPVMTELHSLSNAKDSKRPEIGSTKPEHLAGASANAISAMVTIAYI